MPLLSGLRHALFALCVTITPVAHAGSPMTLAAFSNPETTGDWRFFTDGVMGGVSHGQAVIDGGALRMTGTVSTENNGGFIQARLADISVPQDITQITARVRGDGQTYFLHIRTTRTRLPWQSFQAPFTAPLEWTDIAIPLTDFKPSGALLGATPRADQITSIALVAYGRDHIADVSLATLGAQ